MVVSDRHLIWHPRGQNKFIVGGSTQITLYEWFPESSEIKQVASQLELNQMKCFSWSPDTVFDDLIAVGFSNGRVDLLRFEASRRAHTSAAVSLPPRNTRACNALAFSPSNPNYLAVGLDKVRNDPSLVIWDINSALPALSLDPSSNEDRDGKVLPTLPRGDAAPRTSAESRVVQQHAPAEVVSTLAWVPNNPQLLLAGISHRWLQLFDLRTVVASSLKAASKVHGIATDPFDPHRVACYSEGTVAIWDIRRFTQPVLTFTAKDASADGGDAPAAVSASGRGKNTSHAAATIPFAHVEFSSSRRDTLATLERDASYVRFWDVRQAHGRSRESSQSGGKTPWAGASSGTSQPSPPPATNLGDPPPYHLILADTRRTKTFARPFTSFALLPAATSCPLTSDVILVNKDGDLELARVVSGITDLSPPREPWELLAARQSQPSSRAYSMERPEFGDGVSVASRNQFDSPTPSVPPATFGRGDEDGFPRLARRPPLLTITFPLDGEDGHRRHRTSPAVMALQHVLESDISMLMRRRAMLAYGLTDPLYNSSVARAVTPEDHTLSEMWLWIHHSQRLLSSPSSVVEGYNFSYQGLSGIWEGFKPVRPAPPSGQPTPRMEPAATSNMPDDFLAAIEELNARTRLAQRRFALAQDDLARAIKRWEKEGKHTQAACWLVFTEQHKAAIDLLMRSTDDAHHMMSGMLAALTAVSSSARSPELVQHCERLVVRLQDPYLRALLTQLTVRDWTDVLEEDVLPLRERLAIAFHFLDDKELSAFLRRVADRAVHDGDALGLLVTGLAGPPGIALLDAYVDSSGDVQTAALLASLPPSLARDSRGARWMTAYRDLLDGWRFFHQRSHLDIERGRILRDAIDLGEIAPFEWAPRQILLRCNYCNKPMDAAAPSEGQPRKMLCPNCSKPLPRCCVCLMTLNLAPETAKGSHAYAALPSDTVQEALVFCQTCRHGGHASHILEWFYGEGGATSRAHGTCAVAGCDCRCSDGL
ncbi:uncharacterized protein BXZ73DRAFT_92696 [Epithele typhae]|uniref:uncharacterized protein n=1 Tax=Epithele typhae TaxID=378194 RepID=UPI002007D43C|nr:uncharacterized protein BXZ73DRAFT_92696 [Epithele typhae]KAH9915044.1 hypothetical protein BXZ73DRAFT_92696 [Epithele typhae]